MENTNKVLEFCCGVYHVKVRLAGHSNHLVEMFQDNGESTVFHCDWIPECIEVLQQIEKMGGLINEKQ